jgi:hypothetical protein
LYHFGQQISVPVEHVVCADLKFQQLVQAELLAQASLAHAAVAGDFHMYVCPAENELQRRFGLASGITFGSAQLLQDRLGVTGRRSWISAQSCSLPRLSYGKLQTTATC